jgi:hypothetical protein
LDKLDCHIKQLQLIKIFLKKYPNITADEYFKLRFCISFFAHEGKPFKEMGEILSELKKIDRYETDLRLNIETLCHNYEDGILKKNQQEFKDEAQDVKSKNNNLSEDPKEEFTTTLTQMLNDFKSGII